MTSRKENLVISMAVLMSDKYEYDDIDEKAKHFARMELNEVPSQVNGHIERLRKWVKSMPHIYCPTDAKFLLRFLRVSNFDHEKAQRMLDNFCTLRSSQRGSPSFFQSFSIDDPIVETFLKLNYFIPLGRSDSGEYVALIRTKYCNLDHFTITDLSRLCFMITDVLLSQPEIQIYGVKWIEDVEGVTKKIVESFDDDKLVAQFYTIYQDYLPWRIKAQIFCDDTKLFDPLLQKASPFIKSWLKARTYKFGGNTKTVMEHVEEIIPGLKKILPNEYGGHAGSLDECTKRWSKVFNHYFKNGDPLSSIHVDESMRPKDTLAYFAGYEKLNDIL